MDFNEIMNPYPTDLPPLQMYKDAVVLMPANAGLSISTPRTPTPMENATCLYLALLRSRGGTSFNFDNVGSNAVATDNSGYQNWLVDGWRTPVIYFRWPTKNVELDHLNPATLGMKQYTYRDPEDPDGALFNRTWWINNHNWPAWTPFEFQLHSLVQIKATTPPDLTWPFVPPTGTGFPWNSGPFPNQPGAPVPYYVWAYEYYMAPVVASAGPNKNFGLSFPSLSVNTTTGTCFSVPNPMDIDGSGDDADNIYSYRLRLGAAGN